MIDNILAKIFSNELLVFILVLSLMLAFSEIGFRFGVQLHKTNDADTRRGLVLKEANAERIAAMRAGIPSGVWLLLIMVAAFGCVTASYGGGAEGVRSKLGSVFLPLLIAVVIVLIFDVSHPRVGMIQIGQQPLVDLQQSMKVDQ